MQIEIDPQSDAPIYQQLRDRTVEAIADGSLAPGTQLAPVRQVALAFGINVATVSKAYDALRREGFIRTNHKSGSVVARGPQVPLAGEAFRASWTARLRTLLAEAIANGLSEADAVDTVRSITGDFAASRANFERE